MAHFAQKKSKRKKKQRIKNHICGIWSHLILENSTKLCMLKWSIAVNVFICNTLIHIHTYIHMYICNLCLCDCALFVVICFYFYFHLFSFYIFFPLTLSHCGMWHVACECENGIECVVNHTSSTINITYTHLHVNLSIYVFVVRLADKVAVKCAFSIVSGEMSFRLIQQLLLCV